MSRAWHHDLSLADALGGGVQARRRARSVRALVETATARGPDGAGVTAVRCVAQVDGHDCADWVHVARDHVDGSVAWSCPGCGEHGFVVGFAHGPHDLGAHAPPAGAPRVAWRLGEAELALLTEASEGRPAERATLARVVPAEPDDLVAHATAQELEALHALVVELLDLTLLHERIERLEAIRDALVATLDRARGAAR